MLKAFFKRQKNSPRNERVKHIIVFNYEWNIYSDIFDICDSNFIFLLVLAILQCAFVKGRGFHMKKIRLQLNCTSCIHLVNFMVV